MQVEIKGLDQRTLNRARVQLDESEVEYMSTTDGGLLCESDNANTLRHFVNVALTDPDAIRYR
jgi:hypothetical protein